MHFPTKQKLYKNNSLSLIQKKRKRCQCYLPQFFKVKPLINYKYKLHRQRVPKLVIFTDLLFQN